MVTAEKEGEEGDEDAKDEEPDASRCGEGDGETKSEEKKNPASRICGGRREKGWRWSWRTRPHDRQA